MLADTIVVGNPGGLHARVAVDIVRIAGAFRADITVARDDRTASAKSILGLLSLGAAPGTRLEVCVHGADEAEAMAALARVLAKPQVTTGQSPLAPGRPQAST